MPIAFSAAKFRSQFMSEMLCQIVPIAQTDNVTVFLEFPDSLTDGIDPIGEQKCKPFECVVPVIGQGQHFGKHVFGSFVYGFVMGK